MKSERQSTMTQIAYGAVFGAIVFFTKQLELREFSMGPEDFGALLGSMTGCVVLYMLAYKVFKK